MAAESGGKPPHAKLYPVSCWRRAMIVTIGAVLAIAAILPARAAQAVLQPGEPAPALAGQDPAGKTWRLDEKTSGAALLVFVKPGDKFTSASLRSLEHLFAQQPELARGLRRWIVVSRLDSDDQTGKVAKMAGAGWTVIADAGDKAYRAYKIIATPTLVIVGTDGRVAAVHPGYDPGMEQHVRLALAKARGIALSEYVTKDAAKPNMALQMGRRMAARGLWERALDYYQAAAKAGPLPPAAQIELAGIHVELGQADEALAILQGPAAVAGDAARVKAFMERAQKLKAGQGGEVGKPQPPKITR